MNLKQRFIFSFLMSCIMSSLMGIIITLTFFGVSHTFVSSCLKVGVRNFCFSFPATFIVSPFARKLTRYLTIKFNIQSHILTNLIFAIIMPMFMDLIAASVATISSFGLLGINSNFISIFLKSYINSWLASIPFAFIFTPLLLKIIKKY